MLRNKYKSRKKINKIENNKKKKKSVEHMAIKAAAVGSDACMAKKTEESNEKV